MNINLLRKPLRLLLRQITKWLAVLEFFDKETYIGRLRNYAEPFAYNVASCRVLEKRDFNMRVH